MASSLASIAETQPENVLPQWQQKIAYAENTSRPYHLFASEWIFCTKCNFLQVLDLHIFRQKQPGHWAEVVCHFLLFVSMSFVISRFCFRFVEMVAAKILHNCELSK